MIKKLLTALLIGLFSNGLKAQNPWNGKLVLQGIYWDYENSNYVNSWANYLTELSPGLRGLQIYRYQSDNNQLLSLKQIDFDEKFTTSRIVSVIPENESLDRFVAYPNPSMDGNVKVTLPERTVSFVIYDRNGG